MLIHEVRSASSETTFLKTHVASKMESLEIELYSKNAQKRNLPWLLSCLSERCLSNQSLWTETLSWTKGRLVSKEKAYLVPQGTFLTSSVCSVVWEKKILNEYSGHISSKNYRSQRKTSRELLRGKYRRAPLQFQSPKISYQSSFFSYPSRREKQDKIFYN